MVSRSPTSRGSGPFSISLLGHAGTSAVLAVVCLLGFGLVLRSALGPAPVCGVFRQTGVECMFGTCLATGHWLSADERIRAVHVELVGTTGPEGAAEACTRQTVAGPSHVTTPASDAAQQAIAALLASVCLCLLVLRHLPRSADHNLDRRTRTTMYGGTA